MLAPVSALKVSILAQNYSLNISMISAQQKLNKNITIMQGGLIYLHTKLKGKRHVLLKVITRHEIPNEIKQSISSKVFLKKDEAIYAFSE